MATALEPQGIESHVGVSKKACGGIGFLEHGNTPNNYPSDLRLWADEKKRERKRIEKTPVNSRGLDEKREVYGKERKEKKGDLVGERGFESFPQSLDTKGIQKGQKSDTPTDTHTVFHGKNSGL